MSMTNDEAIRILSVNGWGYTDGELREATQMAVTALKEKSEAEELRTPKKVIYTETISGVSLRKHVSCPACHAALLFDFANNCSNCGQVLDWSEVKIC